METLKELSNEIVSLNVAAKEALSLGSVLNAVTSTTSEISLNELAGTTDILEQRLLEIMDATSKIGEALRKQY